MRLAVTSHSAGRLFLIDAGGTVERVLQNPTGIAVRGDAYAVATKEAILIDGGEHHTSDLRVHDIAFDAVGRLIFVNTKYSCLSTLDGPIWQPPFITELVPEDRCHLNGLAVRDGKPAYVTAFAESDTGWRPDAASGVVIGVERDEIVCRGLAMPHSPRWHDGRLWLLQSGTGEFGYIDGVSFRPFAFIPGFVRGLSFAGGQAFVGVSQPRPSFPGPRGAVSGVYVVDTASGGVALYARLDVSEIYDVAVLGPSETLKAA